MNGVFRGDPRFASIVWYAPFKGKIMDPDTVKKMADATMAGAETGGKAINVASGNVE